MEGQISPRRLKILPRVPAEEVPRGKPRDWLSPDDGKSKTGSRGSLYTEVDGAQYIMSKYPVRCKYGVMTVPARQPAVAGHLAIILM